MDGASPHISVDLLWLDLYCKALCGRKLTELSHCAPIRDIFAIFVFVLYIAWQWFYRRDQGIPS